MKKSTTGRDLIALLGLCFLLISSIISFVIVVEYDPEGKDFKNNGIWVHGSYNSSKNTLTTDDNSTFSVLRNDYFKIYKNTPEELTGYMHKNLFMPSDTIPHAPRDHHDFWFIIVSIGLSLLMIRSSPRMAFVDFLLKK